MKVAELRTQTVDELTTQLQAKRTELLDSRRSNAAGELANSRVIRRQRRDIAQLETLIAEKRREINKKEKDNA